MTDLARRSASAGDINGDGFDDLIVGAPYHDPYAYGSAHRIGLCGLCAGPFRRGSSDCALDGTNGFRIDGRLACN